MADLGAQTARLGVVFGGLLAAIGIGAYVASGFASVTALIPTVFGVIIAALGVIARDDRRQQYSIYGIGLLAALGVAGSLRGVPDILALLTGAPVESLVATLSQAVMIGFCLVLLGAVVRYVLTSR